MTSKFLMISTFALAASLSLQACQSNQSEPATASDPVAGTSGGATTGGTAGTSGNTIMSGGAAGGGSTGTTSGTGTSGTGTGTGTSGSIPTLVSVNLQNVLNNLSVDLRVNRNNIPVTAQVPIDVAANVCGVSVSALSASIASGQASCTARTTSAQLNQAVQQQMATGGNVTGGDQNMTTPPGR